MLFKVMGRKKKYNTKEERKAAQREYNKQFYQDHREEITEKVKQRQKHSRSTPNGRAGNLVSAYRQKDKKYNRGECTLTPEWIVDNVFSGQVCHYCGESDWTKLGVDRIDNTKPHTPDNVVVCCGECNLKKARCEYDEFMRLIGKVKGGD